MRDVLNLPAGLTIRIRWVLCAFLLKRCLDLHLLTVSIYGYCYFIS